MFMTTHIIYNIAADISALLGSVRLESCGTLPDPNLTWTDWLGQSLSRFNLGDGNTDGVERLILGYIWPFIFRVTRAGQIDSNQRFLNSLSRVTRTERRALAARHAQVRAACAAVPASVFDVPLNLDKKKNDSNTRGDHVSNFNFRVWSMYRNNMWATLKTSEIYIDFTMEGCAGFFT